MSVKKVRHISRTTAKRNFTTIGLLLVLYVLFVMIAPYVFHAWMYETNSPILKDEILYYGIYFLFLLFGTIIPFFMMRLFAKIKIRKIFRQVKASFVDLFVQTIVFFTVCIALTYASNALFQIFGIEGKLLSDIGLSYGKDYAQLNNHLYVFILIVVAPILEEYAFRGVLLQTLSRYGKTFALYATSLLFALAHSNFAEMIPAFAMGIALGKTALRYKSIQATILIHILFNGFIYLLLIMPANIASYMAYGLVAICALAVYLFLSGRYERISIEKSKSYAITSKLFYTRFTIILTMILMIVYTILMSL